MQESDYRVLSGSTYMERRWQMQDRAEGEGRLPKSLSEATASSLCSSEDELCLQRYPKLG